MLVIIHDSDVKQSWENSESGSFSVPSVLWRDINYSHYIPPPHCAKGSEETTNTAHTSSDWLWKQPVTHFKLPMAELLIRLELADARARCWKGYSSSALLMSLTPLPAEGSCFNMARFAFQSVLYKMCWECRGSGLSRVWEICEGALSTHSSSSITLKQPSRGHSFTLWNITFSPSLCFHGIHY